MSLRALELGIAAVQAGNPQEGARLLRIAVKSPDVPPNLRAIAYLWLAETSDDPSHKRACYNDALAADPNNPDARQRLATLLASALPVPPSPAAPTPADPRRGGTGPLPAQPGTGGVTGGGVQAHVVSVIGGANGVGAGFFVTLDGMIATTRYVVGGLERLTVEVAGGRQLSAAVVRAFPDMDLTLLRVDERPVDLLPITPYPRVADDALLIAIAHNGQPQQGRQRPSKRVMAPHWISTTFTKLADAGGSPLFDERNYLVGMLTHNSSRSSGYLFGVHIAAIRRAIETTVQELATERRTYCPHCGALSRATAAGYFFCEVCGGLTPQARTAQRQPQGDPYFEYSQLRCPHCGAQVGFHAGNCLRCGRATA